MTPYGSRNKFGAKKTIYKGVTYDSKKESEYAQILDGLKKEKKIKGWERQVRFPLPDLNYLTKGSMRSYYAVDFLVTTLDGAKHLVEVKGVLTDANKIKYAFVQYLYNRPIHIIRTTGLERMNTSFLECEGCPYE